MDDCDDIFVLVSDRKTGDEQALPAPEANHVELQPDLFAFYSSEVASDDDEDGDETLEDNFFSLDDMELNIFPPESENRNDAEISNIPDPGPTTSQEEENFELDGPLWSELDVFQAENNDFRTIEGDVEMSTLPYPAPLTGQDEDNVLSQDATPSTAEPPKKKRGRPPKNVKKIVPPKKPKKYEQDPTKDKSVQNAINAKNNRELKKALVDQLKSENGILKEENTMLKAGHAQQADQIVELIVKGFESQATINNMQEQNNNLQEQVNIYKMRFGDILQNQGENSVVGENRGTI